MIRLLVVTRYTASEMMMRVRNQRAHNAVNTIPARNNLLVFKGFDHSAALVERNAVGHVDAQIADIRSDPKQRLDKLLMGHDARSAARQLDVRTLVDGDLPALALQGRSGKEAPDGAPCHDGTS